MKRFLVLAEVEMEDVQYSDLNKKGIEQTDFINSVLADHGRDRGLIMRTSVTEIEHSLYKRLCSAADDFIGKDAIADIEEAVLKNKMCVGGNCED